MHSTFHFGKFENIRRMNRRQTRRIWFGACAGVLILVVFTSIFMIIRRVNSSSNNENNCQISNFSKDQENLNSKAKFYNLDINDKKVDEIILNSTIQKLETTRKLLNGFIKYYQQLVK